MTKLLASSAAASAFLNNTPIVAMLVLQVTEWAQRRGESPTGYLMPLSFAVILGGAVTAIGDYIRLGAPLTVIAIAAIMAAVPYFWPI